jgi:hypothetical protein
MATNLGLGLGRANIKRVHLAEVENLQQQWKDVIGRTDTTTQQYERYKTIMGLGPAVYTLEGDSADFDDMNVLFNRDFYPRTYTKGLAITLQAEFTDQYAKLKDAAPRFAKSFNDQKNIVGANLNNLGFTSTTDGMNSETLYKTAHSNGTATATGANANRPASEVAFSATALQQAKNELRLQRDARNAPLYNTGQVLVTVPPQLQGTLAGVLNSQNFPGTANNDVNYARSNVDGSVVDYYTSATAWFVRMKDMNQHGLFLLQQMPYDIIKLPMDDTLMHKWVAYESYVAGWFIWYGTWGTTP